MTTYQHPDDLPYRGRRERDEDLERWQNNASEVELSVQEMVDEMDKYAKLLPKNRKGGDATTYLCWRYPAFNAKCEKFLALKL